MKICSAVNEERLLNLINSYYYSYFCRIESDLVYNGLNKNVGYIKRLKGKLTYYSN
jgi:hypothetical protein